MKEAASPLRVRMAHQDDAEKIARLVFDVIEAVPLDNAYYVDSPWNKRKRKEAGIDKTHYDLFLGYEIGSTRKDIKNMAEDGKLICVAYEENKPDRLVGGATLSLTSCEMWQNREDVALYNVVLEKFYVSPRCPVRETSDAILMQLTASARHMGTKAMIAYPNFGAYPYFKEKHFKPVARHAKPFANKMILAFD